MAERNDMNASNSSGFIVVAASKHWKGELCEIYSGTNAINDDEYQKRIVEGYKQYAKNTLDALSYDALPALHKVMKWTSYEDIKEFSEMLQLFHDSGYGIFNTAGYGGLIGSADWIAALIDVCNACIEKKGKIYVCRL